MEEWDSCRSTGLDGDAPALEGFDCPCAIRDASFFAAFSSRNFLSLSLVPKGSCWPIDVGSWFEGIPDILIWVKVGGCGGPRESRVKGTTGVSRSDDSEPKGLTSKFSWACVLSTFLCSECTRGAFCEFESFALKIESSVVVAWEG